MARGWESKQVEEQVEQKTQQAQAAAGGIRVDGPEERAAKAAKARQRQELELQRERILDERTSSPIRRAALGAALGEIEKKLEKL